MKSSSFSVAQRLFAAFAIVILISAIVSAFVYARKNAVGDRAYLVTDVRVPTVVAQQAILSNFYLALVDMRGLLLSGDLGIQHSIYKTWAKIGELRDEIDALSKNWTVEANRQKWQDLRTLLIESEKYQREAIKLAEDDGIQAATAHIKDKVFPRVERINVLVAELIGNQRELMVSDSVGLHDDLLDIQNLLIVGAFLTTLFGIFISIAITRSVVGPLNKIIGTMEAMERGELSVDVPAQDRGDEIGLVARTLESFRLSLAKAEDERRKQEEKVKEEARVQERKVKMTEDFVSDVMASINALSQSADSLQGAARSLSDTARMAQEKATAVSAASEEASTNVQTVSAAGEELSASIMEIGRQVSNSIQITARAVDETAQSNNQIQDLAQAADRIGLVVSLISEIAEQTNLLALNATIEAARAGEAGKGFAVVATEVKALAGETAKATQEISEKVSEIQGSSSHAVEAIQRVNTIVEEINSTSNAIAAAVEEQGSATGEIARSVQEAAEGTRIVARDMVSVSGSAVETESLADRIKVAAEELADISRKISQDVSGFAKNINAVSL